MPSTLYRLLGSMKKKSSKQTLATTGTSKDTSVDSTPMTSEEQNKAISDLSDEFVKTLVYDSRWFQSNARLATMIDEGGMYVCRKDFVEWKKGASNILIERGEIVFLASFRVLNFGRNTETRTERCKIHCKILKDDSIFDLTFNGVFDFLAFFGPYEQKEE